MHQTRDLVCKPGMCSAGNRTSHPLVHRPALSPLSHTIQGQAILIFYAKCIWIDSRSHNECLKHDILDQDIVTQWLKKNNIEIYITKVLSTDTKPALGCKQHYKEILNCSDMLHISNLIFFSDSAFEYLNSLLLSWVNYINLEVGSVLGTWD